MNTETSGQPLFLMDELKAKNASVHARLETSPFFSALTKQLLPLESYVGQLRSLALIHGALEPALISCSDERVASVWTSEKSKLPWLCKDLRYFEPRVVADLKEATELSLNIADTLRRLSIEQPLALLGSVYVLEGSTLGGNVLGPMVARTFQLAGAEGTAYLQSYGDGVEDHWKQFQQRMNSLNLNVEERSQILQAAVDFFQSLESVFLALYPFQPESKTFLVTSINPEAGRHAVPANPGEIQAALRAGDSCWERFPYFEQRYGERGRRFARSDAAWKVTLCEFDPEQIIQQIQWLGRVLAGRGMPSWLLQEQLVILVNELTNVHPEKKSTYQKLLPAANELEAARRRQLTDEQLQSLEDGFDQAVGQEWSDLLPHTGRLIGCAVADELNGSELAVDSLRSWLTDAVRFPAHWIAGVEDILSLARDLAKVSHENQWLNK